MSDKKKKSKKKDKQIEQDIPKDWPEKEYQKFWRAELREVMNQGLLRICWTVASTRTLSALLLINKKVSSLKHLSLVHLLVGLFDKTDDKGELKELVHLKNFMVENGAILDKDCKCRDPFLGDIKGNKAKTPKPILCTHKYKSLPKSIFKVQDFVVLTKTQVNEVQLLRLVRKGHVAISIPFTMEFSKFKGDGVYEGTNGETVYRGYHMMVCDGYGTHQNGTHYWDVQNSMGLTWGNNGFGKIIRQTSRGAGKPSLIHFIVYPVLLEEYHDE